jgi:hypothetical protein
MKYSFMHDGSIANKPDGRKQGAIEQNSEGFSTVSDGSGNFGDMAKVKI